MVTANSPPPRSAKAIRLEIARYFAWILSVIFTTLFVVTATEIKAWWIYLLVFIGACLAQYVFTEIESALFTGKIPLPFSNSSTTPTNWIWLSAAIVLLFDILLQLGGVGTFIRYVETSMTGDVLASDFGLPSSIIKLIKVFMILFLSFLSAVGSEILGMYITYIEKQTPIISSEKSKPFTESTVRNQNRNTNDNPNLLLNTQRGNKK